MKSARLHKIGDFRVDNIEIPKPVGDQILIRVGSCGICGSDIPRIFELGTSKQKYPLVIGHEFGGTIVDVGTNVDKTNIGKHGAIFPCIPCMKCAMCSTGDYALCLDYDYLGSRSDGGFAEYCLIPSMWHFVESNNVNVSDNALSMVEPCTVAQHGIRKSELRAGYSCLIFGAGPIGIMAARWAKLFGVAHVLLVDVVSEKVKFAEEHGEICLNALKCDLVSEALRLNEGKPYDVIIEGTGTGTALNQAIETVKTFGKIVLMGNPHKETTIKLSTHSSILRKEVNIVGMWNSHYNDFPINEWKYTVKMLDENKMIVEDLITHKTNLDDLPKLCNDIHENLVTICKAIYSSQI